MKKLVATLSALSLFAASGAFAQTEGETTATETPAVEETSSAALSCDEKRGRDRAICEHEKRLAAEGKSLPNCSDAEERKRLIGIALALCMLREASVREHSERGSSNQESRATQKVRNILKKAGKAARRSEVKELKKTIQGAKKEIRQMRGGGRELKKSRRDLNRENPEVNTEESGQAVLQAYTREGVDPSGHKTGNYKFIDTRKRRGGGKKRDMVVSPRERKAARDLRDTNRRDIRDAAQMRLQRQSEAVPMETAPSEY